MGLGLEPSFQDICGACSGAVGTVVMGNDWRGEWRD